MLKIIYFNCITDSSSPVFIPRLDVDGGAIAVGLVNATGGTNISYITDISYIPTALQERY